MCSLSDDKPVQEEDWVVCQHPECPDHRRASKVRFLNFKDINLPNLFAWQSEVCHKPFTWMLWHFWLQDLRWSGKFVDFDVCNIVCIFGPSLFKHRQTAALCQCKRMS